jgi:hypothetical protein
LDALTNGPIKIDNDLWADFLEKSNLHPSDFQLAIKDLVKEGIVANLDADTTRRVKHVIKPGYPNKSERWVLV